jgi:hypothetical protein
MKRISKLVTAFSLFVVFASIPAIVLRAMPASLQTPPPATVPGLDDLVWTFKSLTGVAMSIAVLVNVLKTTGVAKDDTAGNWSAGLNLAALVALFVAQVLGYSNSVPAFDRQAGELANVLSVVFAFAWQIYVSRKTHGSLLAGLPVVGTSHTGRKAGLSHCPAPNFIGTKEILLCN